MEEIEKLQREYKKHISWGYNRINAIQEAVNSVSWKSPVNPHIYKDEYEDFSHVFYKEYVLFNDGDLYKRIKIAE